MNRELMWDRVSRDGARFDVVVIGGGATGTGVAIDAAARGYSVALFEQHDFGKGTSSRSTKLVHGGVRYLRQGNIPLVMEALRERGRLRRNAPHLVHDLEFVVPSYDWWEAPFYGIGLKVYDALAGRYGFGRSRLLSKDETMERLATIETEGLRGGVVYHDGQFDDTRLLVHMLRTAVDHGAVVVNYAPVEGLEKDSAGMISGVRVRDLESGQQRSVAARAVVNATGVFTDEVRRLDAADARPMIRASQGIHIVLAREFLPGSAAIMVPHTDDGRVLFAVPWHDRVIVGTTDTPRATIDLEPCALDEEIDYVLRHAARYLTRDPRRTDILSVFAGLRPLVSAGSDSAGPGEDTAALSRDHTLQVSRSGLVTITGGKWTTYRQMAEDTVDHAAVLAGLDPVPCSTRSLRLHGWHDDAGRFGELSVHGADAPAVERLCASSAELGRTLHPSLSIRMGEVIWAVRHEMARTVEDVLARRTRALLFDAEAAAASAPAVARVMARELERDERWIHDQITRFGDLAQGYRGALA